MKVECEKCNADVPVNALRCTVCGLPAAPPNVRMASRDAERDALNKRLAAVEAKCNTSDERRYIIDFADALEGSKAVMNRSLASLHDWICGLSPLYQTFHRQVEFLGRTPALNDWDTQREATEAAINPYIYRDLSFAALTVNQRGVDYYGPYSVLLKTLTIEDRATVFEENPFHFVVKHRKPESISLLPPGYRAPWSERKNLAICKHHEQILSKGDQVDIANVIISGDRTSDECDYIEVHIYGPIDRRCIESVLGPNPDREEDKIILEYLLLVAGRLNLQMTLEIA